MSNWENWALDASIDCPDGVYAFVPIEGEPGGECDFITGFTVISDECPGNLVAVIHQDGNNEAEVWSKNHANDLARLRGES